MKTWKWRKFYSFYEIGYKLQRGEGVVTLHTHEKFSTCWKLVGHALLLYMFFCLNCFVMFIAHTNAVNAVSFHPSGNYLVSASSDTTLKVIPNICTV